MLPGVYPGLKVNKLSHVLKSHNLTVLSEEAVRIWDPSLV
jgi:hypothetical protein